MAEILSGSSTSGIKQNFISYTSQSIFTNSIYAAGNNVYRNICGSNSTENGTNNPVNKLILPIPSTGSQVSSSQTYYIMRAFLSGNIIYWSSVNSIDYIGTYSGYAPNSLSFIAFVGTKEL